MQLVLAMTLSEEQPTIFKEGDDSAGNLYITGNFFPIDAKAEGSNTCRAVGHNQASILVALWATLGRHLWRMPEMVLN
jgi:hypothetical protein